MERHKHTPDNLICQFTNPNETGMWGKLDQYLRTRAVDHSKMETMVHLRIEWLKNSRTDNNKDWKNTASLYPSTILNHIWNFYTNVSKSQLPGHDKNKQYG